MKVGEISVGLVAEVGDLLKGFTSAGLATMTFGKKLEAMKAPLHSLGIKLTLLGGIITAVFGSFVMMAAKFDDAMRKSTSIVTDLSKEQYNAFKKMTKEMAVLWGYDPKELAPGWYYMASAGLKAQDMMKAFPTVVEMARAANLDMKTTAEGLVDIMKPLGISFEQTSDVGDTMMKVTTMCNATLAQMIEAIGYVAGVARAAHLDLADLGAVLAQAADAGIKGTRAGTALRRILINLMAPTGEAAEVMRRYGISLFEDTKESSELRKELIRVRKRMGELEEGTGAGASAVLELKKKSGTLRKEMSSVDRTTEEGEKTFKRLQEELIQVEDEMMETALSSKEQRAEYSMLEAKAEDLTRQVLAAGGRFKDWEEVIRTLTSSTQNLSEAERFFAFQALGGARAVSFLVKLMEGGIEDFTKFRDAARNAGGTLQKVAERNVGGLIGQLSRLSAALKATAIDFGDPLTGPVSRAVTKITEFLEVLRINTPSAVKGTITAIGLFVGSIITLLGVLGLVGPMLAKGFATLKILGAALIAAKLGWVALIAALVAGGLALGKWISNMEAMQGVLTRIGVAWRVFVATSKATFAGMVNFVIEQINRLPEAINATIEAAINLINKLREFLKLPPIEIEYKVPTIPLIPTEPLFQQIEAIKRAWAEIPRAFGAGAVPGAPTAPGAMPAAPVAPPLAPSPLQQRVLEIMQEYQRYGQNLEQIVGMMVTVGDQSVEISREMLTNLDRVAEGQVALENEINRKLEKIKAQQEGMLRIAKTASD